ncbi:MAG: hypothetical protein U5L07_17295 [Desulfobacterales bacterium]|nr:hypothetical protein [Desulfobacterales bacterium]
MVFKALNNKLKAYFIGPYADASFVIQQKAQVLLWIHIILIPVTMGYLVFNAYRYDPPGFLLIGTIDIVFIGIMLLGIFLIRQHRYNTAVYINIWVGSALVVLGLYAKTNVQIETGANSFLLLVLAVIAFTAMFARKKGLLITSLVFLGVIIINFFAVHPYVRPEVQFNHISHFLNALISLIILFCLSFFNGMITNNALLRTQAELERNVELNETLEDRVRERTRELQEHIDHIKVLKGLLPICSSCKKIRDDNGYWNLLEEYMHKHADVKFSHGICPECAAILYPEIYGKKKTE